MAGPADEDAYRSRGDWVGAAPLSRRERLRTVWAWPAVRLVLLWVAAVGVALLLDGVVAHALEPHWPKVKKHALARSLKEGGTFYFSLLLAACFGLAHRSRGRAAGLILLSGVIAGAWYSVGKWVVGRVRPVAGGIDPWSFDLFRGGLAGILRGDNAAFPSGHATLAFATATALAVLVPRARWVFFAVAAMLAFERAAEGAHYLSDSVAGAGLGVLSAWLASRLIPTEAAGDPGPTSYERSRRRT